MTCFLLCTFSVQSWCQSPVPPNPSLTVAVTSPEALQSQLSAALPNSELSASGSIHGVVVDPDGSVYEGAQIQLEQPGAVPPSVKNAVSDSVGRFNFTSVPAGHFKLTVSSKGFASQVVSGSLMPGESFEPLPIVLPVSEAASEVRVTASPDEIAEEQVHEEEQQRVLGVIPNFYVSYVPNAAPLTAHQKFALAWRSSIDPMTILATASFAGVQQATNSFSGYGQGAQGYGKRFAANYADGFIGSMIGGAILPALMKQDPRYFYKGTGTVRARLLYVLANSVVCKGDNGHWQGNYSGILGGIAAGGISNLYYPAADRSGLSLTFENAFIGIGVGTMEDFFQEFVVRKLTPRLPNYSNSKP